MSSLVWLPDTHCVLLFFEVANCGLNGILGQYGTVNLDGREREFLGDFGVLNLLGLVKGLSFDPFGKQ